LATPHQGAHLADHVKNLGTMFGRLQPVVDELRANESNLQSLNVTYRENCGEWNTQTRVYFECLAFKGVPVVEPMSADPGITGVRPIAVPEANHVTIAKPSRDSSVYRGVRKFIQDCLPASEL
jgi:hypothetical protein